MSTTQKTLLLPASGKEFIITPAAVRTPGPGDVLVRNEAIALNPADWKIQKIPYAANFVIFPAVIGLDFAGVVIKIGEGVTALKEGDRVLAAGKWKENERGGYQEYTIATAKYATKIPADISFDDAVSLPLTLMTAATGLYTKAPLGAGLRAPWEASGLGHYKGTSILVVGGGSNVGENAIQLAKLSGFTAIHTTASLKHTARLESLGATRVIDRNSPLSPALADEKFSVIFDAIAAPTMCHELAEHLAPGGTLVQMRPAPEDLVLPEGAKAVSVFGSPFHPANAETGAGLFASLEKWLADGDIKTNRIEVLPGGLGGIVGGLARLEKGEVSGVKFVVRPGETA